MTDTRKNMLHSPELLIDPAAIAGRMEELDKTTLCRACRDVVLPVTADTVRLLIEVIRLWDLLFETRMQSANRLAAIRATLGAAADNEADPLGYLRDQLADEAITPIRGAAFDRPRSAPVLPASCPPLAAERNIPRHAHRHRGTTRPDRHGRDRQVAVPAPVSIPALHHRGSGIHSRCRHSPASSALLDRRPSHHIHRNHHSRNTSAHHLGTSGCEIHRQNYQPRMAGHRNRPARRTRLRHHRHRGMRGMADRSNSKRPHRETTSGHRRNQHGRALTYR